jgi:hypothetical protein
MEGGKAAEDLESLPMAIVQIDLSKQKQSSMLRGQSQITFIIYFRLFLGQGLVL